MATAEQMRYQHRDSRPRQPHNDERGYAMIENVKEFADALPRVRRKIFNMLMTGRHLSATDLSIATGACDPRGHIRDLRDMGVDIRDYWETPTDDVRYKRYYIPSK